MYETENQTVLIMTTQLFLNSLLLLRKCIGGTNLHVILFNYTVYSWMFIVINSSIMNNFTIVWTSGNLTIDRLVSTLGKIFSSAHPSYAKILTLLITDITEI